MPNLAFRPFAAPAPFRGDPEDANENIPTPFSPGSITGEDAMETPRSDPGTTTSILDKYFSQSPVSRPSDGAITEFLDGFGRGFVDAASLGLIDVDDEELDTAGSVGEIAGFIAGEVPYWVVGAGAVKWGIRAGVVGLRHASRTAKTMQQSTKYGRRIVGKAIEPTRLGEAATGVAIEAGRSIAGDEEAFTPGRLALAGGIPFIPALKATRKLKLSEMKDLEGGKGVFSEALDNLDPADSEVFQGFTDIYRMKPSLEEKQIITKLYNQGASMEDLLSMVGRDSDEISEFAVRSQKKGWTATASKRSGTTDSFIEALNVATDRPPDPTQAGPLFTRFSAHDFNHTTTTIPTDPSFFLKRALTTERYHHPNVRVNPWDAKRSEILDRHRIMEDHDLVERYSGSLDPRTLNSPRGRGAHFLDKVHDSIPIYRKYLASTLRGLESLGEPGRQLATLLDSARGWHNRNAGNASVDMLNTVDRMAPEEVYEFVRVADGQLNENAMTSAASRRALAMWRMHQKIIEDYYVDMGAMARIQRDDGLPDLVPLSKVRLKNLFPHHFSDAKRKEIIKDPRFNSMATDELTSIMGDKNPNIIETLNRETSPSSTLHAINRQDEQAMTRNLHARQLGLKGYKGDPDNFKSLEGLSGRAKSKAMKAQKRWVGEVQDTLVEFLDSNYGNIAKLRYTGTPKDFTDFDDVLQVNAIRLDPIQRYLKKRLGEDPDLPFPPSGDIPPELAEQAAETLRKSQARIDELAGELAPSRPDISKFKSIEDVERAVQGGDADAIAFVREAAKDPMVHPSGNLFSGNAIGWGRKARTLVNQIAIDGNESGAYFAGEVVDHFLGIKQFSRSERAFSEGLRNFQLVSKLGLAVIENATQTAFTATRFGFGPTLKALRDTVFNREMTTKFSEQSGALLGDMLRTVEVESGESWAGKFLRSAGFAQIERLNRKVGAVAGKYFVMDQMENVAKEGLNATQSIRLLDKLGFKTKSLFNADGTRSDLGIKIFKGLESKSDESVLKVIEELAGFRGAQGTQFLGDLLDNPLAADSPFGKIFYQFKTFAFNGARSWVRDIMDEASHGNYAPLVRMVLLGTAMGEVTQDARMIASGRDPWKRGQHGIIREMTGSIIPTDDEEFVRLMGERFSKSDVAARVLENVAGVGYAGVFVSMFKSAAASGKLGLFGFMGGPTIEEAIDIGGSAIQSVRTGNIDPLVRRAIREGSAVAGTLPGVRSVKMSGGLATAFGRSAQLAVAPSRAQMEESLFLTDDEAADVAIRGVVRVYNDVRDEALSLATEGNTQAANARMIQWNRSLSPRIKMLREMGAFQYNTFDKISFSVDDMNRTILKGRQAAMEPGLAQVAMDRASQAFTQVPESISRAFSGPSQ